MKKPRIKAGRGRALKWLAFGLLCALPLYGSLRFWWVWEAPWILTLYGVASLLTFALYWHDKRRARVAGWRVPENLLHLGELLGGWPGALLAQQKFRHKTRKQSFQLVFLAIVLLHQLFWVERLVLPLGG